MIIDLKDWGTSGEGRSHETGVTWKLAAGVSLLLVDRPRKGKTPTPTLSDPDQLTLPTPTRVQHTTYGDSDPDPVIWQLAELDLSP